MSLIASEYLCPEHGRFDLLVERPAPDSQPCPECNKESPWVISAPMGRVKLGEVTRGKSDEKPHPMALDTRPLADGMPMSEWKAQRRKMWREHRWKQAKNAAS